ncbi:hypothetical protein EEW87_004250 [Janibacter melonis]|uniref:DUF3168 domain-containing protein n=1 Tax=Janibacter melonis TaxID=262209 RepID=A0A5P8FKV8_9MICO|nr:hypothetical protein [Janibacter melonis]QFQ29710.2 hypothetical protein EEW87_004250 [Janibacter melonis]
MTELLAPPDVEVGVVGVLRDALPDARVGTRYPSSSPEPPLVVRVSAVGGQAPRHLVLVEPRVLVECWADDEGDAFGLAGRAHAHLSETQGQLHGMTFRKVLAQLPVNHPDVGRPGRFRFQFVATVYSRMEPLA